MRTEEEVRKRLRAAIDTPAIARCAGIDVDATIQVLEWVLDDRPKCICCRVRSADIMGEGNLRHDGKDAIILKLFGFCRTCFALVLNDLQKWIATDTPQGKYCDSLTPSDEFAAQKENA